MIPPFCSLHAIAAERGDGLHPELLRAMRYWTPEQHVAPPQILAASPITRASETSEVTEGPGLSDGS